MNASTASIAFGNYPDSAPANLERFPLPPLEIFPHFPCRVASSRRRRPTMLAGMAWKHASTKKGSRIPFSGNADSPFMSHEKGKDHPAGDPLPYFFFSSKPFSKALSAKTNSAAAAASDLATLPWQFSQQNFTSTPPTFTAVLSFSLPPDSGQAFWTN